MAEIRDRSFCGVLLFMNSHRLVPLADHPGELQDHVTRAPAGVMRDAMGKSPDLLGFKAIDCRFLERGNCNSVGCILDPWTSLRGSHARARHGGACALASGRAHRAAPDSQLESLADRLAICIRLAVKAAKSTLVPLEMFARPV